MTQRSIVFTLISALVLCAGAEAARVKDLVEIQGARGNALTGIGLVVGLAGTGDNALGAIRAQERMLRRLDIEVSSAAELNSDNVAVVIVTAEMPAFAKEGTRIDINVSSLYDAESLEGGTLLETLLYGIDDQVYAVGQGPLSTGGFNADANGASVRKNHVTVGRVPMGGFVEREIPSTITDGERILLLLKRPDFGTASNIQDAINASIGTGSARALGAGTISVLIPEAYRPNLVEFIAKVEELEAETEVQARVVINERTGTIVVGGNVMVQPCHVAHGGLRIRVAQTPVVSQPLPFSEGFTVEDEVVDVEVEEEEGALMPLEGVSAADVAEGLNRLMVSPRDMISIFQALHESGVLDADVEIM